MKHHITGKVIYLDLEGGFWGIISDTGEHWMPLKMPASLKKEGLRVKLIANERDDVMGIGMWGSPIRIISYEVLDQQ